MTSHVSESTTYVKELWERREFAVFLAMGKLKARNASSVLGLVWWILNPLILASIYFLVFGFIFEGKKGDPEYLGYLLAGMFPYQYTSGSIVGGANSIIGNGKLILNLRFPRLLLPLSEIVYSAAGFGFALFAFAMAILPLNGFEMRPAVLIIFPAFLLQTLLNVGLGCLFATLVVWSRDVRNLLPFLLRLWLYLSPIIWPVDRIGSAPEIFQVILKANPMYSILEMYRGALLGWDFSGQAVLTAAIWSVGLFVVGLWTFRKNEAQLARHL